MLCRQRLGWRSSGGAIEVTRVSGKVRLGGFVEGKGRGAKAAAGARAEGQGRSKLFTSLRQVGLAYARCSVRRIGEQVWSSVRGVGPGAGTAEGVEGTTGLVVSSGSGRALPRLGGW